MKSETVEDYLKAIYELQTEAGKAKTSQLAEKLNITAGSVTEMLKRLSRTRPEWIRYQHHRGARLTKEGQIAALGVIRRHRLLETFLHDVLKLTWSEVHAEAEALEHHLSPRVTDALETFLEHPRFDPHGEPIPDRNGRLPLLSEQRLSDVPAGTPVRVVRVEPQRNALLNYLDQLGIGIDTALVVVEKAPLNGPVTVRVAEGGNRRDHALGREVADALFVSIRKPA